MENKEPFIVEQPDEKWLYIYSNDGDMSYIAIRFNKPQLKISKRYLKYGDLNSKLEEQIKKLTGKSSKELSDIVKSLWKNKKKFGEIFKF